jgi:hypothetical protein
MFGLHALVCQKKKKFVMTFGRKLGTREVTEEEVSLHVYSTKKL